MSVLQNPVRLVDECRLAWLAEPQTERDDAIHGDCESQQGF
jgi:hypothetical protein